MRFFLSEMIPLLIYKYFFIKYRKREKEEL